jgi:hypothetical protein
MTKPMIRIHNTSTNQIIDREMNDAEFAEFEANQKIQAEAKTKAEAETAAKEATRLALLDKLGLTADEAKLLLGSN